LYTGNNTHFVMFWDPFLRVCFGPQNSNIHPCDQSPFSKTLLVFADFFTVNAHHTETGQRFSLTLTMDFQTCRSLATDCLFSHSIKLRGLPLSVATVSLHYLPRCQDVCFQQSHAAKRLPP